MPYKMLSVGTGVLSCVVEVASVGGGPDVPMLSDLGVAGDFRYRGAAGSVDPLLTCRAARYAGSVDPLLTAGARRRRAWWGCCDLVGGVQVRQVAGVDPHRLAARLVRGMGVALVVDEVAAVPMA